MRWLLADIRRRDHVLSWAGWAHLALVPILAAVALFDQRLILGQNAWIKPLKFALSNTVYVWTIAWFLVYIKEQAPRAARLISLGVAASMLVEIVCIAGQSARGVPSHFNVVTEFDGAISSGSPRASWSGRICGASGWGSRSSFWGALREPR